MRDLGTVPAAPPENIRFRHRPRIWASLLQVWDYRGLVRSLAERDLRARYKQAALGALWVFAQPLSLILVFTFIGTRVTRIDTGGVPYVLFASAGMLSWTFFTTAINLSGASLVLNTALLSKTYCPREVFPLAGLLVAAVDASVAAVAVVPLMIANGLRAHATVGWVPLLVLVQLVLTAGLALLLSSVMVYARDLRSALPLVLQIALFATPVAYGIQAIPEQYRMLYSTLNPMAPLLDSYRRTVLLGQAPDWHLLGPAALASVLVLAVGLWVFKRLEVGFADIL